jgi:hypothetical protein
MKKPISIRSANIVFSTRKIWRHRQQEPWEMPKIQENATACRIFGAIYSLLIKD